MELASDELSDDAIGCAMEKLGSQFSATTSGLEHTGMGLCQKMHSCPRFQKSSGKPFVQVLNVGDHWICVTNVFGPSPRDVYIFDSLYVRVDDITVLQVSSLLRDHDEGNEDPERDTITFHVRKFDVQSNKSRLCGFYALAAAVSCCLREDPTGCVYDETQLINSYHEFLVHVGDITTPFPSLPMQVEKKTCLQVSKYMVYCVCHEPYKGERMVQCSFCANWYHFTCITVRNWPFSDSSEEWRGECCATPATKKLIIPSALKSVQLDHCNRLQQKYQQDIDLLDDLRLFMRQRAVIEKVYAQSLCKLVQQYLVKRQFPAKNPGESENADSPANKTLLEVWKNVLDETRNVAMVRLAAAETYIQKISEQCKQVRANRSQIAKLVFEELNSLQKDILLSLQEMNKSQKVYREEEHIAYDARVKATNASNKVKNKAIGRFTSLAKLQQQSSKMNARVEACEVKSTAARNEYILNLRAANAHLDRYHAVDIPDLIQVLDGEYFDVWKHFLTLFTTTELQCSSAVSQCFGRVATDVNKISRQYNTECFMKENPVLTETLQYPFVPQDDDPVTHVSKDHQAELDLDREARKWATKIARENRTIRKTMKTMSSLKEEKNKAISASMEFLVSPTFAASEIKLEEERCNLRLAETGKAKAEARIEALREGGVEVDVWLNSANADTAMEEDESCEGNATTGATKRDPAVQLAHTDSADDKLANMYAQVGDHLICGGDIATSPDRKDMIYPLWCVAVYDYEAANEDELTIHENENLVLLGQGDGDGWMRARNGQQVEGLVPENYIRVWNPAADSGTVDVNEENVDDGTLVPYAVNNPKMNVIEPEDKLIVPYAVNNSMMNVIHPAKMAQNPMYAEVSGAAERWARALFDYEATCEEELSFQEGQLIRIISTEHDGVDDGWWEGEVNGSFGLFPSLVVEELLPIRLSDAVDRQTSEETPQPENLSAGVYGNLDSVAFQNAHKRPDGAIVFNATKNQRSADGMDNPRIASPIVQSLFNDGTESAV